MADTMVVVDKLTWRHEERTYGDVDSPLQPGYLLPWRSYKTRNEFVERYLEPGDRLFLVTARGERLWLAAVYEGVHLKSKIRGSFKWVASRPNRVPIIDVTPLRTKLKFHTGNGLTTKLGALGNSLQTPRKLTEQDLALLEAFITKAGSSLVPSPRMSTEAEALEGQRMLREVMIYERDPDLALACIKRDGYKCRLCGFTVDEKRFPTISSKIRARIVQVHHVRPVCKGKRRSKVSELLTLCPTCHVAAHAIATATKVDVIDLSLLRRFYRP